LKVSDHSWGGKWISFDDQTGSVLLFYSSQPHSLQLGVIVSEMKKDTRCPLITYMSVIAFVGLLYTDLTLSLAIVLVLGVLFFEGNKIIIIWYYSTLVRPHMLKLSVIVDLERNYIYWRSMNVLFCVDLSICIIILIEFS
jgi:hypothetical protein